MKRLFTYMPTLLITIFMMWSASLSAQESESAEEDSLMSVPEAKDSLQVSLITCSPGTDIYAMYGHTAIRVVNFPTHLDLVFNYGMFNYNADSFVFKFLEGKTDYILGVEPGQGFFQRYGDKGNEVVEQILNLTQEECRIVFDKLMENAAPENRMYRYNWLYNNCTTRARDILESAINGDIEYTTSQKPLTVRQILHRFTCMNSWIEFGADLILGAEIDTLVSSRIQMFIPSVYENEADSAFIVKAGGMKIPLVADKQTVLESKNELEADTSHSPFICFLIILIAVIVISIYEIKRSKTYKWIDVSLSILQGLAGTLVAFLFFLSVHAGVDSNVLVILLNPLAFVWIYFYTVRRPKVPAYATLAELLLLVLTLCVIPQHIHGAVIPLALILMVRAVVNLVIAKKQIV